jgi:choline kinase/DNA-binding XRE family transcriptional regulator
MTNTTFGNYIRRLRNDSGLGLREFARQLDISASYLNDIEKQNRDAPKAKIVATIADKLGADRNIILDLAAKSRKAVAADISEMIQKSPETIALLRAIRDHNPSEETLKEIRESLMNIMNKVIIIAAGLGSRMKGYTETRPKCLLEFGDKTLLQRQIEAYNDAGISDISLVRGYRKETINYKGINYYDNDDYENNNILNSLFYAEEAISGPVIISYSDILFESSVVKRLIESKHDISIVVDIDWRDYYVGRIDHPIDEAENVIFDANNDVIEIGKIMTNKDDVHAEFIGMLKLSSRGAEIFKKHFHKSKSLYWGKPFQRAALFQKAYLTDLLQEMANLGVPIHCVIIARGWKEIDTVEDYKKALTEFNEE